MTERHGGQSAARPVTIADGYPELERIAHARLRSIIASPEFTGRVNAIIAEGCLQWRPDPAQYCHGRRTIGA